MEIYRRKSREKGLKVTPQRAAIYEELLRARDHPTAEAVYRRVLKRMPNISFDTVNRTLLTFAQIGITKIVEGYGQAKRY
ncbi:MAG: transcriptional repressor, partial [Candidatus Aminicenantes bacterium]|nr:transcriptional repressor [Candidatus Aminicenantes bacterium]